MFQTFDAVCRDDLVIKASVYNKQILMILFNKKNNGFALKVFQTERDAQNYLEALVQKG